MCNPLATARGTVRSPPVALHDRLRAVARGLFKPQPVFEETEEEERADAARRVARAAGGEDVGRDADVLLADDLEGLDEGDALRAEGVDLLVVCDALCLADQTHLLGLGLARREYVVCLALAFASAL